MPSEKTEIIVGMFNERIQRVDPKMRPDRAKRLNQLIARAILNINTKSNNSKNLKEVPVVNTNP